MFDFETDSGTIEHILPESYPEPWHAEYTEEEFERNVFMIGNLTLLEASKNNKEAADKVFEEKKTSLFHQQVYPYQKNQRSSMDFTEY